jgi:trimethylamine--corrinoid protein Co-methyltransferase
MNAAAAQICDFYKIPFGYGTGGLTDSSVADQQCGVERAYSILYAALAGVDVIHHAAGGLLGGAMVASYEDMVIANEICNMINLGLQGIRVNEDTLAVNCIREVGPGGHFLDIDHTLKNFRHELFLSNLLDRRGHNERSENEPSNMLLRAKELAKHILENHQVPGFKPEVEEKIQLILDQVTLS